ncbi:MAG: tRNA (cytidine(34)-2'-O)-methyltransferase [Pseudomonadota bacterium]
MQNGSNIRLQTPRLAAYQPDIPQNTGALIRLAAAFGVPLELIEPFGFLWDERKIRVSAMDYYDQARITRHASWHKFTECYAEQRIVLLTTKTNLPYTDFSFQPNDVLLLGRESAGVPDDVHKSLVHHVTIPLVATARSFNVAMAGAIVLAEALRQIGYNPKGQQV